MQNLKSEAAKIIAENIRSLDGIGTHSPYTMIKQWESLFDDVKTGKETIDVSKLTSSKWKQDDAFFGDSGSETQMTSSLLHGNTVQLSSVDITRNKRFVKLGGKYILVDDPHTVDYVLCHVKGYRKYKIGTGFFKYVKARDVIISGTLLSIKEIIEMLKSEIEELINNEM